MTPEHHTQTHSVLSGLLFSFTKMHSDFSEQPEHLPQSPAICEFSLHVAALQVLLRFSSSGQDVARSLGPPGVPTEPHAVEQESSDCSSSSQEPAILCCLHPSAHKAIFQAFCSSYPRTVRWHTAFPPLKTLKAENIQSKTTYGFLGGRILFFFFSSTIQELETAAGSTFQKHSSKKWVLAS